jgi:hypothetical protein
MWRAFFLAIGIYMVIFGLECLGVDRVSLKFRDPPPPPTAVTLFQTPTEGPPKQFVPAPWVPWSLISSGAVVCLYSFTIPRRMAGK